MSPLLRSKQTSYFILDFCCQQLLLKPILKVTIDVSSPEAGVIQKLIAKEGDTVEPGTKVAIISKSAGSATLVASSDDKPFDKAAPPPSPAKYKKEEPKPKEDPKPKMETKACIRIA